MLIYNDFRLHLHLLNTLGMPVLIEGLATVAPNEPTQVLDLLLNFSMELLNVQSGLNFDKIRVQLTIFNWIQAQVLIMEMNLVACLF